MFIFLTAIYSAALPYWDTLKRKLAEKRLSSLTIIYVPNIVGHPIGIFLLLCLGLFVLPTDPVFYLSWFGMVVIASFSLVLNIWGLLKTEFFGVQILSRLGFLANTIVAVLVLGERLTELQVISLGFATVAILFFTWPKRIKGTKLVWDMGVFFIVLSLIIGAFSTTLYKLAALHTSSYPSFLSGRFVADLIAWTIVWVVGLMFISRLNPLKELKRCLGTHEGMWMAIGLAGSNLLGSLLIYELPVVTVSMIGTVAIPSAYLYSRFKYGEQITTRMWIGTALSAIAIVLFLYPG
jgi:drug/metabolite transporter (DMT)-like permease